MTPSLIPNPLEFAEEHFEGGDYHADVEVGLTETNVMRMWRNGTLVFDVALGGWLVDPASLLPTPARAAGPANP